MVINKNGAKYVVTILCIAMMSCSCRTIPKQAPQISIPDDRLKKIVESEPIEIKSTEMVGDLKRIYVGHIDDDTMKPTVEQIKSYDKTLVKGIIIEFDSTGGQVDAGRTLSKAIEESEIPVYCFVDGNAMSMAFYILQSCELRVMTKRSVLMVHKPIVSDEVTGNTNQWGEVIDDLVALQAAMAEHEARRMKITPQQLAAKIEAKSWFMNWEEAQKIGAVDQVVNTFNDFLKIVRASQQKKK